MKSPNDYASEVLAAWYVGRLSLREAIVEAVAAAVAEALSTAGRGEPAHDQTAVVNKDGVWYRRGPDGILTPLERRPLKPVEIVTS